MLGAELWPTERKWVGMHTHTKGSLENGSKPRHDYAETCVKTGRHRSGRRCEFGLRGPGLEDNLKNGRELVGMW